MRMQAITGSSRSRAAVAVTAYLLLGGAIAAAQDDPGSIGVNSDPALLHAMQRDLGLDAEQLQHRLSAEQEMSRRHAALRELLGDSYAGGWLSADANGEVVLTVAVTDGKFDQLIRAAGASVHPLTRSLQDLETIRSQLNEIAVRAPVDVIAAHYIDVRENRIVVLVEGKQIDAVSELLARSDLDLDAIRIEEAQGLPRTAHDVRGGDRYNIPGSYCSIGFSITKGSQQGYATAGHCGNVGTTTTGFNGVSQGIFEQRSFPGNDYAWVRITNAAWVLKPWVNNYAGGNVNVIGEQEAPIGATICRSGTSSNYRCGVINAKNVTVNYPQGSVSGLWRISACVTGGDSGGSVLTPAGHAQGVTSGGQLSGGSNCHLSNPVTYIQPWLPLRNAYGLNLVTSNGGTPPQITQFVCPDRANSGGGTYACRVSYNSAAPAQVQWVSSGGGPISGGTWHFGNCTPNTPVFAQVTVTNAHGSDSRSANFSCPGGMIP